MKKVICINIKHCSHLTLYKVYDAEDCYIHSIGYNDDQYQLYNDENDWCGYPIDKFITLKEYRKMKILKLNEL